MTSKIRCPDKISGTPMAADSIAADIMAGGRNSLRTKQQGDITACGQNSQGHNSMQDNIAWVKIAWFCNFSSHSFYVKLKSSFMEKGCVIMSVKCSEFGKTTLAHQFVFVKCKWGSGVRYENSHYSAQLSCRPAWRKKSESNYQKSWKRTVFGQFLDEIRRQTGQNFHT